MRCSLRIKRFAAKALATAPKLDRERMIGAIDILCETHAAAARCGRDGAIERGRTSAAHGQCGDSRTALLGAAASAQGASAASQGLVLVTRKISDFEVFDGLQLLNWFEEP